MTPAILATDLTAGYQGRTVLNQIALSVSPGERVVLLGPNGSGKSTLLKALVRSLPHQSGSVQLEGLDLKGASPRQIAQKVAFVPQEEPARFPFLVSDVVAMGRLARSNRLFDTAEDRAVAKKAMERADCAYLADRFYTELSGGERQRVLIARALAQETPLILLDEPTSHLDPAHQVEVATLVASLSNEGVTTLAAVHDLNLASRMADRAILLERGVIRADGPVQAILTSPTIDQVYGVTFERVQTEGGSLALLPRASSS